MTSDRQTLPWASRCICEHPPERHRLDFRGAWIGHVCAAPHCDCHFQSRGPRAVVSAPVEAAQLTIETERAVHALIIRVVGEIDVYAAPQFERSLEAAMRSATQTIELDLSEVPFVDSAALRMLVGARASANERGMRLIVTAMHPTVQRTLELSGLLSVLVDVD
jgi:anti-sigma B factor antagonist